MSDGQPSIVISIIVLPVIILSMAIALILVACTVRRRRRHWPTRAGRLASAAVLVSACALAVYAWGALHMIADETMTDERCKAALSPVDSHQQVGNKFTYLPLGFGCRLSDGTVVEAAVPRWINPTFAVLTLSAAVLALTARAEAQ